MKKEFLKWRLLSLVLVLTWIGCPHRQQTNNANESLEVLLPSIPLDFLSNRSIENLNFNHYFKDVTVYLKYGNEKIHTYAWSAEEIATKKKLLQGVGIPPFIYVVVNGEQLANAPFASIDALTDAHKSISVESQNISATLLSNDANGNLAGTYTKSQTTLLSGTAHYTRLHPTINNARQALVQLVSSIARFELGTLKAADPTKLTSVTVDAVYVDNYYTNIGTDTLVQIYGSNWSADKPPDGHWSKITGNNALVTSNDGTKCYAFQLFPDIVPKFIYEISGTLAPGVSLESGETGNFAGKYISITGFTQLTETLQQNNIYKIGLINGGIPINVEDIGASMGVNALAITITIQNESTITLSI